MKIEELKNIPHTNIGKMIGDVNSLDWMDFEKLEHDITIGSGVSDEIWFIILKCKIKISKFEYREVTQCFREYNKSFPSCLMSNNDSSKFIFGDMCLNQDQIKLIKCLLNGEIVTLKNEHLVFENSYKGKQIAILDTWKKKKAVKKIERNWLICRYDPRYKMCGDVLMHNIEEARNEYLNSISF
jgi:hypothetical protein